MTKPNCSDFIVTAIRTIRLNPPNLKKGTKAGVAMHRLWSFTSEVYSKGELRQALNQLLTDGAVVATWSRSPWVGASKVKGQEWRVHGAKKIERISSIPQGMPIEAERIRWYLSKNGKFVGRQSKVRHDRIMELLFYVTADGLPQRVSKLTARTTATQILAAMQKS